jgi:hypothetical protein
VIGFWIPGSDGFDIGELGIYAGIITAVAAALTALYRIFMRPITQRIRIHLDWNERFRQDWEGTPLDPDRPWDPHSPGVLERLNALDGEFHDRGNGSLKASVRRIETAVNQMSVQMSTALERMDERLTDLEDKAREQ